MSARNCVSMLSKNVNLDMVAHDRSHLNAWLLGVHYIMSSSGKVMVETDQAAQANGKADGQVKKDSGAKQAEPAANGQEVKAAAKKSSAAEPAEGPVFDWLKGMGMQKYHGVFLANCGDDMQFIATLEKDDVAEMVVDADDQAKVLQGIATLK